MNGRDVLFLALSGAGKSEIIAKSIIERRQLLQLPTDVPHTLVICPFTENASLVATRLKSYGKNCRLPTKQLGGGEFDDSNPGPESGILVGWHEDLLHLVERNPSLLSSVQYVVIDDANQFPLEKSYRFLDMVARTHQTLMISAVESPEILDFAKDYLRQPEIILVDPPDADFDSVEHWAALVPGEGKSTSPENLRLRARTLRRLLAAELGPTDNAIVFTSGRKHIENLTKNLQANNARAVALHSDFDTSTGHDSLERFRSSEFQILVTSDITARDHDIPAVSHIFHFTLPVLFENNVHRIEFVACPGRTGDAIALYNSSQAIKMKSMQSQIDKKFRRKNFESDAASASANHSQETRDVEIRNDDYAPPPPRSYHAALNEIHSRHESRDEEVEDADYDDRPPPDSYHTNSNETASFPDASHSNPTEAEQMTKTTFRDLGLAEQVLNAVEQTGYTVPTPIQAEAIPHILENRDLIGIAQTGSGKTAAFTLPMISVLSKGRARARMPRSLILCPTRELAAQIANSFKTYGKGGRVSMALLIGGESVKNQTAMLGQGTIDVLIATPGRLLDHIDRGTVLLTGVQIAVLDEADRMLDMGFLPDIRKILGCLPVRRQTLLFSATMPPEIVLLTKKFLSDPAIVEVARPATTTDTVRQWAIPIRSGGSASRDRSDELIRLLREEDSTLTNAIVFCNRKRSLEQLVKTLQRAGFDAIALHGDLAQPVRTKRLENFRNGKIRLLVASDVAARGLDIPIVSHVLNYEVPLSADDYVHRIGRTARAGRSGIAITLFAPTEFPYLAKIEELIKKDLRPKDYRPAAPAASARAPAARGSRPAGGRTRSRQRPRTDGGGSKRKNGSENDLAAPRGNRGPRDVSDQRNPSSRQPSQSRRQAPRSRSWEPASDRHGVAISRNRGTDDNGPASDGPF